VIVHRAAGYRETPWKNGGGSTREIHREPPESSDFDWRLSLASIAQSGPFSDFTGYERTLVLVRGAHLELAFEGHGAALLASPGDLVGFPGEWPTGATLHAGACEDMNVIVRRRSVRLHCRAFALEAPAYIGVSGCTQVVLACIAGSISLETPRDRCTLNELDVARCRAEEESVVCRATVRPARLIVARLF
jgi:uncharacterized protein